MIIVRYYTNVFLGGASLGILQHEVNIYLDKLCTWLQYNKVQLSVNKTKYMLFGPIIKATSSHNFYSITYE